MRRPENWRRLRREEKKAGTLLQTHFFVCVAVCVGEAGEEGGRRSPQQVKGVCLSCCFSNVAVEWFASHGVVLFFGREGEGKKEEKGQRKRRKNGEWRSTFAHPHGASGAGSPHRCVLMTSCLRVQTASHQIHPQRRMPTLRCSNGVTIARNGARLRHYLSPRVQKAKEEWMRRKKKNKQKDAVSIDGPPVKRTSTNRRLHSQKLFLCVCVCCFAVIRARPSLFSSNSHFNEHTPHLQSAKWKEGGGNERT
jgi:hypothetical protein